MHHQLEDLQNFDFWQPRCKIISLITCVPDIYYPFSLEAVSRNLKTPASEVIIIRDMLYAAYEINQDVRRSKTA